jgi:hypothetical protein
MLDANRVSDWGVDPTSIEARTSTCSTPVRSQVSQATYGGLSSLTWSSCKNFCIDLDAHLQTVTKPTHATVSERGAGGYSVVWVGSHRSTFSRFAQPVSSAK